MFSKITKMSLFWQCTLLFAIFVCGESIFWGLICYRISQAEQAAKKQAQFNEVLRHSQTVATSLSHYQYALGVWKDALMAEEDPSTYRAKVKDYELEMKEAVDWLSTNLNDYPKLKEQQKRIAAGQKRMFRLVHHIMQKAESMHSQIDIKGVLISFYFATNKERMAWQAQLINMLEDETKVFSRLPSNTSERQSLVLQSIIGSLLFNTIYAFVLFTFLRGLKSRTLILVENTKRYLCLEPFLEPMQGDDELSLVDKKMHEMRDSIEAAQKERQAFLAVVSHELRTPLASILGPLELLGLGMMGKLQNDETDKLHISEDELNRVLTLINDLLDLEKLESGKLKITCKTIYIDSVIEKAMVQVAKIISSKSEQIGIEFSADSDAEVNVSPERMAQAIANLILNAVYASPPGQSVEIVVQESSGEVELQICDRGPGINAKLAPTLFERFRKSSDEEGQIMRGMGLPIARHLVEAQNGKIGYRPREDGGSLFWIRLSTVSAD